MRYYFEKPVARKVQKGPVIKRLLVRCPTTSRLAPTGQTINEKLWPAKKVKASKLVCPYCRQVHNWSKDDVLLAR